MAEGILKYNLPEERNEFNVALHGLDFYLALMDVDNELRNILKHDVETKLETPEDALEYVRELIREKMNDRSVSFDMVE